jgi:hypothetical protein
MLSDGILKTVECKTDPKARETGNIFFETVSVSKSEKQTPGWGWTSQADYWVYLIPDQEILVFCPGDLRAMVWSCRDSLSEKSASNKGYRTLGYPVNIARARKVAIQSVTDWKNTKPNFVG